MRSEDDLDRLLPAFISKDPKVAAEFHLVSSPIIRRLARRFGRDLPADLMDEVVSETYVLLLSRSGQRFDPRLGSAWEFLFGIVANAVKNIRAKYRAPGFPSRYQEDVVSPAEKVVVFDEKVHGILLRPAAHVESGVDLETLLTGISTLIAAALIAIYVRGEKTADVVRRLGISRFQIYRTVQSIRARALSHRRERTNGTARRHHSKFGSAA